MILFYTGSIKPKIEQKDPDLSLGGYISSSIVPNGSINNLFPNIGLADIKNVRDEIKIIALQNVTGSNIANFKIWFDVPDGSYCKFQLGVSSPMVDGENNCPFFEMLQDTYCLPYYTTFADYNSQDTAYEYSTTFAQGALLGLFIKRSLNTDNNPDINATSNCDQLYQQYLDQKNGNVTPVPIGDDIVMNILW